MIVIFPTQLRGRGRRGETKKVKKVSKAEGWAGDTATAGTPRADVVWERRRGCGRVSSACLVPPGSPQVKGKKMQFFRFAHLSALLFSLP